MRKKRLVSTVVIVFIFIGVWNYPLKYRVGINGEVFERKIPLYAKVNGYLYRDWAYKNIVDDIIGKKKDPVEKVLAILRWVNRHVMHGIPSGLDVVDDHPLNIIIRQYGANDQVEDVFTILCSYAGMEAGMHQCYNSNRTRRTVLSLVRVDDRWLIFDAAKNKYFLNKEGKIGSIDDYFRGNLILSNEEGMQYKEFLYDLKNVDPSSSTRAKEQMPAKRLMILLERAFRPEKRPVDDIELRPWKGG